MDPSSVSTGYTRAIINCRRLPEKTAATITTKNKWKKKLPFLSDFQTLFQMKFNCLIVFCFFLERQTEHFLIIDSIDVSSNYF